jgi:hypothetical protein
MSDDDQTNGGDMGGVDLEDHATNMANAHKDLCGMAGIDDHVGHYEDATQGDDEAEMGGDDPNAAGGGDMSGGDDMQMGRRTGNLRKNRRTRPADVNALVERAVGKALGPITKSLDELRASLAGGLAPRNENGDPGTRMEKAATVFGGDPLAKAPGEGSLEKSYADLSAEYAPLKKRADEIIGKLDNRIKLTPEEEVERNRIGKEMSRIEVKMGQIRKQAAQV